ncbi:40426_t:CDS:2 [Gigaspora margarita]|uniref:40426_t:CDS:1 n=1 Tax=Gigaspora margarita TaxID=4874 RepID=A0ABN7UQI8_GIGMA|nr:40426_t:CDS:2 [Gigaspora margarita]
MTRLQNQEPIIIIPRVEMDYAQEIPLEYNIIRLHFLTISVKYKSNVKDQFIQEIRNALSNPDNNEKITGLREKFNEWGSFTVTDVIINNARCGKSPVFNDSLLSNFPKFETSKKMKTMNS